MSKGTPQRQYTLEEVAQHNSEQDCWIVVQERVLDVTKFLAVHPAGKKVILALAGKDATAQFSLYHDVQTILAKYAPKLQIGTLSGRERVDHNALVRSIPYAYPNYLQVGWHSPYFTDSHLQFERALNKFLAKEIRPHVPEWEEKLKIPKEFLQKCGAQGLLTLVAGEPWPTDLVGPPVICGLPIEKTDIFYNLMVSDGFVRQLGSGATWGLLTSSTIGLPPVMHHGSKELRQRVGGPCARGEAVISLAITEPWAGSDVAALKTSAVKSECGKYYIVSGMKKWITAGTNADYLTTAVVTDADAGMLGVSLIVVETKTPGVSIRSMKVQGQHSSGTSFIVFEKVKVPVENLIGKENYGFKYIMVNFNHERLALCMQGVQMARSCVEEALQHAHRRKTFGKTLIEHPVIREKLAHMIRQVEASYSFLEQCCYSYQHLEKKEKIALLSSQIALCKVQATKTLDFCAREAVQIFGGLGYTKGGQGGIVEKMYRDVKGIAIPGGSEEIMLDLGIRMTGRLMPEL